MNMLDKFLKTILVRHVPVRNLVEWKKNILLRNAGNRYFIACVPKSGSTFLSKAIAEITGYGYTHYFDEVGFVSEQNLSEIKMCDTILDNLVVHQHILGSKENLKYLNMFGIRPVVLVRNIFDCLLSLRDHMHIEGLEWPFMFYVDNAFYKLSEAQQKDFLVQFAAPWYVNFYSSWVDAINRNKIKALLITYEDLIADKFAVLSKVLAHYEHRDFPKCINRVIDELEGINGIRFNKGKVRLGIDEFSSHQIQSVKKLAMFYPHIDFSKIGIS